MKNIRVFLSENFQFLEVKFSIHLNRHVFVMRLVGLTIQPDKRCIQNFSMETYCGYLHETLLMSIHNIFHEEIS